MEEVVTISGATGEGVPELLDALIERLGLPEAQAIDTGEEEDEEEGEAKPWSPI